VESLGSSIFPLFEIGGTQIEAAWVILLLPLIAAIVIATGTLRYRKLSAAISCSAVLIGLVLTLVYLIKIIDMGQGTSATQHFNWIGDGVGIVMMFGCQIDALSVLMLLVVTGVGGAIHIYSIGYMADDEGFSRFFACMSLFTFSMLGIVLSTNFAQIFIFWELVGVSSYLLIGFWYQKPSAAEAGKKAFMVNRVGDFGFLLGILLLYYGIMEATGSSSLNFAAMEDYMGDEGLVDALGWKAPVGALLVFCGALGKSAQMPLHVWLPDAMEGPTPVSALIHAATMVAAGVYMLCRVFFLFIPFETALTVVAYIGGFTAFLAASIAFVQNDIKKILAYSTLSQLGYMVMAVGLAGPTAGMFHLTTHAFFKALLFLGSGSIILACHHEQDIWKMGGLRKKMPVTFWTFIIGTIALMGLPPFSGFFSKDEILAAASYGPLANPLLSVLGVATAVMTAFYMGRCCFVTFGGKYRGHGEVKESPKVMTIPLIILAFFSITVGWIGWPGLHDGLQSYITFPTLAGHEVSHAFHWDVAIIGTCAALIGLIGAWLIYHRKVWSAEAIKQKLMPLHTLLDHKYYFDEFYLFLVLRVQQGIAILANWFEQNVLIKGIVNNIGGLTLFSGDRLRRLQTGHLHTYVFLIVTGLTLIVYLAVVIPGLGG
jgi:NADH-quinone oxidoreductase subunit L